MALVVKNLAANTGNTGSIPVGEDLLEKEMATHSSIFAWRIPWTEEPGGLQTVRVQRVEHNLASKQWRWDSNHIILTA